MFGDCPIFFSLRSFLKFDFGSLVVLQASLGLGLFVESSWRFPLGLGLFVESSFVFGDCPIFFSLGSFLGFDLGSLVVLGFDFGSLVVLEVEGFSWQEFSLGLV